MKTVKRVLGWVFQGPFLFYIPSWAVFFTLVFCVSVFLHHMPLRLAVLLYVPPFFLGCGFFVLDERYRRRRDERLDKMIARDINRALYGR